MGIFLIAWNSRNYMDNDYPLFLVIAYCFTEGKGLTRFKIYSEYIICMILLITIIKIRSNRKKLSQDVYHYIILSLFFTIREELAFTFYISAYWFSNLIGYFLKIISFFFIYKAIIETALRKPYDLLFRNLKINEAALERERASLEEKVNQTTKEFSDINKKLVFENMKQKKKETTLSLNESMLQEIFHSSTNPLVLMDKNCKIMNLNISTKKYYNVSSLKDVKGKLCYKIFLNQTKNVT